ncbi:ABC transporter permease [Fodinisporobacter ferrooxydans]|uniref:ABC transporter permease n=1 Tax=Fodinisporobacter ferrooxydans TaxID=2901836 RepID=A0ABY4CE40_9BACL|nr:ABC transporter permease [Alicyclobacillaceae bacterium MYW30-H2]
MSYLSYIWSTYGGQITQAFWQHLFLVGFSLVVGAVLSIPLGIYLTRSRKLSGPVISVLSIIQTIPSLAFFALLLPILGIGITPALIVLFLYSLLPIVRNTYTGVKSVDPELIDVAKGMGMTSWQRLIKVELPLSAPLIVAGLRLSTIYLVSWATVAALIGAGGFGNLIFAGIDNYNNDLILSGSVPTALMAFVAGLIFTFIRRLVTPAGLRGAKK